jgi:hypothetical protein
VEQHSFGQFPKCPKLTNGRGHLSAPNLQFVDSFTQQFAGYVFVAFLRPFDQFHRIANWDPTYSFRNHPLASPCTLPTIARGDMLRHVMNCREIESRNLNISVGVAQEQHCDAH